MTERVQKQFNIKNKLATRFAAWLLLLVLFVSFFALNGSIMSRAEIANFTEEELISAMAELTEGNASYMLYDAEQGQILLSKNASERADASLLAKMMTCLIALENHQLTDKITATSTTVSENGTFILNEGTTYTVSTLVGTALAGSADNVLRLLAESTVFTGDEPKTFVERMNEKAMRLGMTSTFFTNADGSANELQKTSVSDIVIFLKNALANKSFQSIYCSPIAVSWDGVLIDNPNNLVIENTTSTLGGSYGNFSSQSDLATVTYSIETSTDDILNYRKLLMVISGVTEENYLVSQKALLNEFETNWEKTLFRKKNDIVNIMEVGSEELSLAVDRDVFFYAPAGDAEFVENISFSYIDGYSPDVIQTPIYEGTRICTVRYRLKDGITISATLQTANTIVTEKQTVNKIISLMQSYPELFFGALVLFAVGMFCSMRKIYWHFALK